MRRFGESLTREAVVTVIVEPDSIIMGGSNLGTAEEETERVTGLMYSGGIAGGEGCIGGGLGGAGCISNPRTFSSLSSSSDSFSSSSVPSSTTTSGARTMPFCLVIDIQRL